MTSIHQKSGKPLSAELEARLRKVAAASVAMVRDVDHTVELPDDADMDAVVAAVLTVAEERNATLERLRTALRSGRDAEALDIARELCNLPTKGASRDGKQKVH